MGRSRRVRPKFDLCRQVIRTDPLTKQSWPATKVRFLVESDLERRRDDKMTLDRSLSVEIARLSLQGIKPVACDRPGAHAYDVRNVPFVVEKRYQLTKLIGNGSYGVVVAAVDTATNERVAIKKVGALFDDLEDAKRILREIRLMRMLQHENVRNIDFSGTCGCKTSCLLRRNDVANCKEGLRYTSPHAYTAAATNGYGGTRVSNRLQRDLYGQPSLPTRPRKSDCIEG